MTKKVLDSTLELKVRQAHDRASLSGSAQLLVTNGSGRLDIVNESQGTRNGQEVLTRIEFHRHDTISESQAQSLVLAMGSNYEPSMIIGAAYALGYHAAFAPHRRMVERLQKVLEELLHSIKPLTVPEVEDLPELDLPEDLVPPVPELPLPGFPPLSPSQLGQPEVSPQSQNSSES